MSTITLEGLDARYITELHTESAIGEKQIRSRLYQSVTAEQLPPQFADYQRRAGLLIPIRTVRGEIESFQLKPNQPRTDKHGKAIKYETAANAPQVIDVPASVEPMLANPHMPLVITEGAKKVDSAISHGLKCTIGLQGVYGWRGTNDLGGKTALPDWELIALNLRKVLIAFDSDVMTKPSVRLALERLAAFLRSKGAKPCFLVMPPLNDGSKCGLDDWFANGRTREQLMDHVVAELPALTALTSPEVAPKLRLRYLNDVETKEVDWLWPNWLPKGMLTLLGGFAGDGKSTLTIALAAALSTGCLLPDGTIAPITNTLLVLAEDDVSHVVKGRLEVHGADTGRIITLDDVENPDGSMRTFSLRTDVPLLRQAVEQHGIGLIVIDPLSSVLANGDRNSEGDVRDTLAPLVQMMEETGVAVLGIMHIGKTEGRARAMQNLMGSTAFSALARSIWMVNQLPVEFQFPDQPLRKVLGVAKSNYAVAPFPISFSRPLDGALEFHGVSPVGIEESFTWKKKTESSGGATEMDKAEAWLLAFMDGKRVLASEVEAAAKEEGLGFSTVKKAKERMNIASVRESGKWYWCPVVDTEAA